MFSSSWPGDRVVKHGLLDVGLVGLHLLACHFQQQLESWSSSLISSASKEPGLSQAESWMKVEHLGFWKDVLDGL